MTTKENTVAVVPEHHRGLVTPEELRDAALNAWTTRAERRSEMAINQLRKQLRARLRLMPDSYEVDPTMFDDQQDPTRQVGSEIDGLRFGLRDNGLVVVVWTCAHKNCPRYQMAAVGDITSLGKALADGEYLAQTQPRCEEHA